jgi:feruloyl esterase
MVARLVPLTALALFVGAGGPRVADAQATRPAAPAKAPVAFGSSCSALAGVAAAKTNVTFTLRFPTGTFDPGLPTQHTARGVDGFADLPEFCRTVLIDRRGGRSLEAWMPTETWNGRLVLVGRDPAGAPVNRLDMADALTRGFATASLDDGVATDTDVRDRIHDMALALDALLESYFGQGPRWSYWSGCAAGAWDGLLTADRFPGVVDGILARALAGNGAVGRSAPLGLAAFRARRGKLLVYDRVAEAAKGALPLDDAAATRFFLRPAGAICRDTASQIDSLARWVEQGVAPDG